MSACDPKEKGWNWASWRALVVTVLNKMNWHFIVITLCLACSIMDAFAQEYDLANADQHFRAGRFGDARLEYETIMENEAANALYERLQQTYLALGLAEQARSLAQQRRSADFVEPWPGSWHCDMGMIAIQSGDEDELAVHIDALSKIDLQLQPHGDPRTLECLAFHEVFAGRFEGAQRHLERLATHETFDEPPPNLAFLYLRQGQVEVADRILIAAERRAMKTAAADSGDPEPHFELAEFAAMRGEVSESVAALNDAMDRGLGQTWWIYQLFDPDSIPDPVFQPLYGHHEFERMRASVVDQRIRMLATKSK